MKINLKNINIVNICLCLMPLLVPSYNLTNTSIVIFSMLFLHFLVLIAWIYISKFFTDKAYYNLIKVSLPIVIVSVLGFIFSLIFKDLSEFIVNLLPYIIASELLLIMLFKIDCDNIKENLKNYCEIMPIFSVILLVLGFLRELIGLASLFNIKLILGNFKGVVFFRHTAGGILLLGVLMEIFYLIINKKEEK